VSISADNSSERPRFGIEKPRHADNPSQLPFWAVHVVCLAAIWTGITWQSVAIAVAFYGLRIFGIGAGYHRYFSHKTFKTSRWFQFVLAFLAMTTAQKGVLWWAEKHRRHHKYSDQAEDIHSPLQKAFGKPMSAGSSGANTRSAIINWSPTWRNIRNWSGWTAIRWSPRSPWALRLI
jgi:Delta-9 acyl-phospholipid desaturase (EC 1.14.19.-)